MGARNATARRPNGNGKHHSGTTLLDYLILNGDMAMPETGMWPTPNARDHKDSGPTQGNRKSPNLGTVAHWPTPKGSPSGPDFARANREGSGGDDLATAVAREATGSLNPTWVEVLMGFPPGYTDLRER